jgi:16S rRNA (adenine1518-N6/adenine1519-N6)-dimethyltransferase
LRVRGLRARHGMGQNFLISRQILTRITENAQIVPGEELLEIGPGLGFLTHFLLARGARVTAYEMDPGLADWLGEVFGGEEAFHLVRGDFLQADLSRFGCCEERSASPKGEACIIAEAKHPPPCFARAIANLPYNITSPALERLFTLSALGEIIVMVQRQVAERILAKPGTRAYGSLSLFTAFYSAPELLFHVSPGNFHPAPSVYSSVVRFRLRPPPLPPEARPYFFALTRAVFSSRRKTLRNSLRDSPFTRMNPALLDAVLRAEHTDGGIRGETLSMERFVALALAWIDLGGKTPGRRVCTTQTSRARHDAATGAGQCDEAKWQSEEDGAQNE